MNETRWEKFNSEVDNNLDGYIADTFKSEIVRTTLQELLKTNSKEYVSRGLTELLGERILTNMTNKIFRGVDSDEN